MTDLGGSRAETAKTYKTDKTDLVGNHEFLRALFGGLGGDAAPVVTSFAGKPATATGSAWLCQAWREGGNAPLADANN